jgi:hypothetical protein
VKMQPRRLRNLILGIGIITVSVFLHQRVFASASGLNNIPTADVVGERKIVFQQWTNFGKNQRPVQFIGVKGGPLKNVELGLDGKIGPSGAARGPLTGQMKIRLPIEALGTALAIGAANLNGDSERAGDIFPYMVGTQAIRDIARIHIGFDAQEAQAGFFAGVDTTVTLFERDFMPRADLIQINRRRDLLGSVGFLYALREHIVLEGWYSFSSDNARVETFTAKLNLAF